MRGAPWTLAVRDLDDREVCISQNVHIYPPSAHIPLLCCPFASGFFSCRVSFVPAQLMSCIVGWSDYLVVLYRLHLAPGTHIMLYACMYMAAAAGSVEHFIICVYLGLYAGLPCRAQLTGSEAFEL